MFALTGSMFSYSQRLLQTLDPISKLSTPPKPHSTASGYDHQRSPASVQDMIDRAKQASGKPFWGLFPAMTRTEPVVVVVGELGDDLGRDHNEWDNEGHTWFYFDQYSGKLLASWNLEISSVTDGIRAWHFSLHRGTFGGITVKVLWALAGIGLAIFSLCWVVSTARRLFL
jgi:uncharacterized iron-regulated membrane protein